LQVLLLEGLYALLVNNSRESHTAYRLPSAGMLQLGMVYEV